jgi:hypothetical protein
MDEQHERKLNIIVSAQYLLVHHLNAHPTFESCTNIPEQSLPFFSPLIVQHVFVYKRDEWNEKKKNPRFYRGCRLLQMICFTASFFSKKK